jgi:hypothetical protein
MSHRYLDNGDNNTLFFLMPVAVIVSLSYLFLRLDFLVIQLAAMLLSFCGHYYIDSQYHVAGSWLAAFRGSVKSSNCISSTTVTGTATSR